MLAFVEQYFTESVLVYVGAVVVLKWLVTLFIVFMRWLYLHTTKTLNLNVNWDEFARWAVITGGSDGIGRAYAEELASKGFNIVIISRNRDKLDTVAAEIAKKYSIETKTISIDFFEDPSLYDFLKCSLDGLDIGVLVNNVGMSYKHTEYFHALPGGMNTIDKLIKSNIVSCTMMTRIVLPQMLKKKRGLVINISSLTALYPMPLLNVYSASKAYVDYFSRALHEEYKQNGIIIQSVLPGYVATQMSKRRPSLEIPSAETYVKSAMKTVGLENVTFGYTAHNVRGAVHKWLRQNMPTSVNMAIALYYMRKSRERYFQKRKFRVSSQT